MSFVGTVKTYANRVGFRRPKASDEFLEKQSQHGRNLRWIMSQPEWQDVKDEIDSARQETMRAIADPAISVADLLRRQAELVAHDQIIRKLTTALQRADAANEQLSKRKGLSHE